MPAAVYLVPLRDGTRLGACSCSPVRHSAMAQPHTSFHFDTPYREPDSPSCRDATGTVIPLPNLRLHIHGLSPPPRQKPLVPSSPRLTGCAGQVLREQDGNPPSRETRHGAPADTTHGNRANGVPSRCRSGREAACVRGLLFGLGGLGYPACSWPKRGAPYGIRLAPVACAGVVLASCLAVEAESGWPWRVRGCRGATSVSGGE